VVEWVLMPKQIGATFAMIFAKNICGKTNTKLVDIELKLAKWFLLKWRSMNNFSLRGSQTVVGIALEHGYLVVLNVIRAKLFLLL